MNGFLKTLVGGPVWVDAQAQRIVDAGMHALMRAGIGKALIRYTLFAGAIMSLAASDVCSVMADKSPYSLLVAALFVAVYIVWQRSERKIDEDEDANGMLGKRAPGMKIWWWVFAVYDGCALGGLLPAPVRFSQFPALGHAWSVFSEAFDVFMLLVTYSARTPPRPPAQRTRLVFAEANR